MTDLIIIALVLCIVISISRYLYKAKKSGQACIGCPHGKQCSGKCCTEADGANKCHNA